MRAGTRTQASAARRLTRLLARLPVYVADMRAHPGWTFMFVFGRFLLLRRVAAAFAPSATRGATPEKALAPLPVVTIVDSVRRTGIATGLRLPAANVAEIRAFAEDHVCFAGMDRRLPFLAAEHAEAERHYGRKILVGHFLDTVLKCPAAASVMGNSWLRAVAAGYFQAEPKVIATRLWWSFPTAAPSLADLSLASQDGFHFDLDDWRQLKAFFYLTDVDKDAGAHVYVRGSHARRPLSHQFTLFVGRSEPEIVAAYGADAPWRVTGPAGTGFVEDPFGYHTGTAVRRGRRLVLEISFGIADLLGRRRFGELTPRRP
jgi:hypothetical protein